MLQGVDSLTRERHIITSTDVWMTRLFNTEETIIYAFLNSRICHIKGIYRINSRLNQESNLLGEREEPTHSTAVGV